MATNEGIHSVTHAIRILEQFQMGEGLSASEISQRVGIPRATTHRLLKTFLAHQILVQGSDKKYRLTLRLMELGHAALAIPSLQQAVQPFLASLVEMTQETGHFSILDGYHVGYIAKHDSPHPFRMLSHVGWRGPLHATASGKMFLSHANEEFLRSVIERGLPAYTEHTITDPLALEQELQKVRVAKFAVDDEELSEGLYCISVPVAMGPNRIGSLSVSGPKQRMTQKWAKNELVQILNEKSKRIAEHFSYGQTKP